MTECSRPIVEANDTTKAEEADEVTISDEPTTTGEASAQSAVIQMPEQTAPKRRAPRVKFQRINADLARAYPPDGDTKLWWFRLKSALGTTSSDFVNASLFQLQAAARLPAGGLSETAVNAALAMIEAAQPRDEIEGALAVQMACTHTAVMAVLARLGNGYGGERRVTRSETLGIDIGHEPDADRNQDDGHEESQPIRDHALPVIVLLAVLLAVALVLREARDR